MKRLKSIMSSESDSDEIDISKIKNKYKRSKKETDSESKTKTTKIDKNKKILKNQLTLDAFSTAPQVKTQSKMTLDKYFQKQDITKKVEITPTDYFSRVKKSDLNNNSDNPTKTLVDPCQPIKIQKSGSKAFVKENSPEIKKNETETKTKSKVFVKEKSPEQDLSLIDPESANNSFVLAPTKKSQLNETMESPSVSESKKKGFVAYLSRQGPSALGSKPIPEGQPNCLVGMTFVMTGVLESIEREDAQKLIEKYGGRVTKALSGKTTYLVVGSDPGESKVQKAQKLNTKQINEDELFEIIRSSSKNSVAEKPTKRKLAEKSELPSLTNKTEPVRVLKESELKEKKSSDVIDECLSGKPVVIKSDKRETNDNIVRTSPVLLVDKYRPTTMKQIVGQHGDRSPANKLLHWLGNWEKNYKLGFKKNEEGDHFRAVLLSGSPGIGKTTTAHVACRQVGYRIKEYNASCSRSKKDLAEVSRLSEQPKTLGNESKLCIIMDELDGMAGNEDRGGMSELIAIIKSTKCPIICICNDRQATKMRSIVNHLYDLKFRQLTLDQIKGAVKSVIFKEKISVPDEALNDIIQSMNYDMRQILNSLQMWSASGSLDTDTLKSDAKSGQKEFRLGPFDVIGRVFSHEHARTFNDKLDLFFEDYNLGGLFVQENYPLVQPFNTRNQLSKTMKLMSLAADSIAMSDIVSRKLRSTNNWGLLPVQGMFASVIPGEYLHGRLTARIQFPSWLGKFSKQNKNARILSNLCQHLRNSTRGGVSCPTVLAMDYGQLLTDRILRPLREGDVETTLNVLDKMNLLREDIDLLVEATSWSQKADPMVSVSSQVKAMLTRAYNKANFKVPYSIVAFKKTRGAATENLFEGEEEEAAESVLGADEEEEEKSDLEGDCMIKKTVKSKQESSGSSKTGKAAESKSSAGKTKRLAAPKTEKGQGKKKK